MNQPNSRRCFVSGMFFMYGFTVMWDTWWLALIMFIISLVIYIFPYMNLHGINE